MSSVDAERGDGSRGVPLPAVRAIAGTVTCAVLFWFAFVRGSTVPLLGLVDLGFHELGHLVTAWAPRLLYFAAGSIAQVAVPLGLAAYFLWVLRDAVAGGLCLAWAGTSAQNVSFYIADAPYERLPLIGGMHDWAHILGPLQLHMLGAAHGIALGVTVLGFLLVASGFALCCWSAVASVAMRRGEALRREIERPGGGAADMWR